MGFWYADGCISLSKSNNHYYKVFYIYNTDEYIIKKISEILGQKFTIRKKRKKHHKNCHRIKIYSDRLFDFCYSITNTTEKSKQGNLPQIPQKCLHHFIRGYFDGDGSIHWVIYKNRHRKETKELRSSFTAGLETGSLLDKLQKILHKKCGIRIKKISVGKMNKKLKFGQYETNVLCEWMYKDATIFMERKKKIWDEADKKRLVESKKYWRK